MKSMNSMLKEVETMLAQNLEEKKALENDAKTLQRLFESNRNQREQLLALRDKLQKMS